MNLRLIVTKTVELKRPPAPPIKRRKVEEERGLSEQTKRELIAVHVLNVKNWKSH